MNGIILNSFRATVVLGIGLAMPCQAQFMDGVQEIIVSAPVSNRKQVNMCYGDISRITRCDYQQAPLSEMTVPFWGQIVYTGRIVPNAESRATFFVTNESQDCALRLKDETFMRNTRIMGNGNVLSWDISQASLGDGTNCFKNNDQLFIVADITVSIENGSGNNTKVQVSISNAPEEIPSANSYQLQATTIKTAKQ